MLGVTVGKASHNASNARGVTAGKMGRNSSYYNNMICTILNIFSSIPGSSADAPGDAAAMRVLDRRVPRSTEG